MGTGMMPLVMLCSFTSPSSCSFAPWYPAQGHRQCLEQQPMEGAGLGVAWGQVEGFWCMLIYALTGRLWTVLFVRAIPTIFF